MKKVRVGVMGAGFIGRTHIRSAASVAEIEIAGYVDPMAKTDKPELSRLRSFPTLEAMAADGLDGVVIALPDDLHVPVATRALELGLAVLLEKPAATSLEECLRLAAAPNALARLQVGHQRRHHPASRLVRSLIDTDRLGKVVAVAGVFALRKDDNYFVERPRGVGLTNLIHDLDILQFYCGRLTHVSASVSHRARGAREEDTLALVMDFETGIVGSMVATDSSPSPWGWDQSTHELPSIPFTDTGSTYSLLGTKAALSIPNMRLFEHRPGESWHQPLIETSLRADGDSAYVNQLAHFADVIRGSAKPNAGINEALSTQAGLEAVFVSAREGRRVALAELIDAPAIPRT